MNSLIDDHSNEREDEIVDSIRGTVLHVFDHSFPINDGYAFRSAEIVRFLRREGWRTAHITSAKQGETGASRETVDDLDFYRTLPANRIWRALPVVGQVAIVTTLKRRLVEVIHEEQPVLLHVHSPCLNGIAARLVARQFGLPIIYEVRALWEDGAVDNGVCTEGDLRYRLSRKLEMDLCRKVDHVVTICEGLRTDLVSRGLDPSAITVVPSSVDLDRFSQVGVRDDAQAVRLGLTAGKTFGFIGTFFPYEGLEILIRAVPAIIEREPQARFLLVGDGPDCARVQTIARELGIERSVIFTGRVPHSDVRRCYDLIDVLVYPRVSKRVTELVTPLKPLEAMAQGKVVVASDVGGHREMVFPGRNGMLFRAGDQVSLAETCIQLLNSRQEWNSLRESGRKYVWQTRGWERNVTIYDQLYRRILSKSAGQGSPSIFARGL